MEIKDLLERLKEILDIFEDTDIMSGVSQLAQLVGKIEESLN